MKPFKTNRFFYERMNFCKLHGKAEYIMPNDLSIKRIAYFIFKIK